MKISFVEMCVQDPVITFEHAGQVQPRPMQKYWTHKNCVKNSLPVLPQKEN